MYTIFNFDKFNSDKFNSMMCQDQILGIAYIAGPDLIFPHTKARRASVGLHQKCREKFSSFIEVLKQMMITLLSARVRDAFHC